MFSACVGCVGCVGVMHSQLALESIITLIANSQFHNLV